MLSPTLRCRGADINFASPSLVSCCTGSFSSTGCSAAGFLSCSFFRAFSFSTAFFALSMALWLSALARRLLSLISLIFRLSLAIILSPFPQDDPICQLSLNLSQQSLPASLIRRQWHHRQLSCRVPVYLRGCGS